MRDPVATVRWVAQSQYCARNIFRLDDTFQRRAFGYLLELGRSSAGNKIGGHRGRRDCEDSQFGPEGSRERKRHGVESGLRRTIGDITSRSGERGNGRNVHNETVAGLL